MTRNILGVLAIGIVLGAALGLAPRSSNPAAEPLAAAAQTTTYSVDAVHSSVIFKIEHMGLTNFYGRFNQIDGSYAISDDPAGTQFDLTVKADSVDTNSGGRDRHLKSADFFNVTEYPTITFKSTNIATHGEGLRVTGDLTMHGVTRPVTVDMKLGPAKETRQGVKHGFETTFAIKRSDFDMSYGLDNGGLGDEVTIIVAVEGAKK